jgi:ComF family protein
VLPCPGAYPPLSPRASLSRPNQYTARVTPSTLVSGLVDFFYPERCVNCGRFGTVLCTPCELSISSASTGPRCPLCSARWDNAGAAGLNCPRCLHMDAIDHVYAAADMEGAARRVVHALKYRGVVRLAAVMAKAIAPLAELQQADMLLAVPLHRQRQRQRGFNQSARILAELGRTPSASKLLRVKNTSHQVGMHLGERRSNISGAFAYEGPRLDGCRVAILDDVVTTGATANECARVLREHGARHVSVLAYARANYDPAAPSKQIFD